MLLKFVPMASISVCSSSGKLTSSVHASSAGPCNEVSTTNSFNSMATAQLYSKGFEERRIAKKIDHCSCGKTVAKKRRTNKYL